MSSEIPISAELLIAYFANTSFLNIIISVLVFIKRKNEISFQIVCRGDTSQNSIVNNREF
jgi:hypothetical protein